jgi:hypothetical protein
MSEPENSEPKGPGDWDDIEFELECSGREAGLGSLGLGAALAGSVPMPPAPSAFSWMPPATD